LLHWLKRPCDRMWYLLMCVSRSTSTICKQKVKLVEVGSRDGAGCGLGILLHNPKARACAGLVFGLNPQARTRARPPRPGQARPTKARARSVKPEPALFRPSG
jgi:hypothetical protein